MLIVVHGFATSKTLLSKGFSQRKLVEHLSRSWEEGNGASIVVLGRLRMLFYDLDAMRRAREIARELVGGDEAWRRALV